MKINKILILASAAFLGACQVITPTKNVDAPLDPVSYTHLTLPTINWV